MNSECVLILESGLSVSSSFFQDASCGSCTGFETLREMHTVAVCCISLFLQL